MTKEELELQVRSLQNQNQYQQEVIDVLQKTVAYKDETIEKYKQMIIGLTRDNEQLSRTVDSANETLDDLKRSLGLYKDSAAGAVESAPETPESTPEGAEPAEGTAEEPPAAENGAA